MLTSPCHRGKNRSYKNLRHVLMKQVAHRADEDAPGLTPVEWLVETVKMERHAEGIVRRVPAAPPEPLTHALGIAIPAPVADLRTPGYGVPRVVGPFNLCLSHQPPGWGQSQQYCSKWDICTRFLVYELHVHTLHKTYILNHSSHGTNYMKSPFPSLSFKRSRSPCSPASWAPALLDTAHLYAPDCTGERLSPSRLGSRLTIGVGRLVYPGLRCGLCGRCRLVCMG